MTTMRTMVRRLPILLLAALLAACSGTSGAQPLLTAVTPSAGTAAPAGTTPTAAAAATAGPQAVSTQVAATLPASATAGTGDNPPGSVTTRQAPSTQAPGLLTPSTAGSAAARSAASLTPATGSLTGPTAARVPARGVGAGTAVAPLPSGATPGSGSQPLPAFSHVFIIIMENHELGQIAGSPNAPYLNRLAQQYARAGAYYGVSHPSLPNYLALIGGDTFGVASDCLDCFVKADNLVSQLEGAGRSWKAYMEDMPQPCFTEPYAGDYAQRHNPFIYFDDIRTNPARCGKIVPLTQFDDDLKSNSVPDFTWITPNVCNDMHDCPVATGDQWLGTWVPKILASSAWKQNGVLFILFDEGTTAAGCCRYAEGGRIDALVISPLARPGFVSQTPYDHYSLLRTIETAWRLPLLRKAACDCTAPMTDFFTGNGAAAVRP